MSDLEAALASVRGELETLDRRREDLDRERQALERKHAELSAAVRVMERHASRTAPPSSRDDSRAEVPLTQRVLNAIVDDGVATRADLLRGFRPGVNANSVDSAVLRLIKRGAIRREGRRLVAVVGSAEPGSVDPSPASPSETSEVPVSAEEDRPGTGGPVQLPSSADGDRIPLTTRVLEAVASSTAVTRRALVQHFRAQGVKEAAVDTALAGLRKRRKLARRVGGVLAVPDSDVPSALAGAVSPDS